MERNGRKRRERSGGGGREEENNRRERRERHWITGVLTSLKDKFIDEVITKWVSGKHRHTR